MEPIVTNLLFENWQRKGIALLVAIVVWVFVNQSITETKTITNVPVRVVNIPNDKTISGLLPNGYLSHRATLTLSGSKDVIDKLEPGDLEIKIDANIADSDDWVVQINKKNLVSLEPSIDLVHHITNVSHSEFIVKLSELRTENIPILIMEPTGSPPEGYELLDIWPQMLTQTLSGPEEEINRLKLKGLKLTFDLSKIKKEDLDLLGRTSKGVHSDEISYLIPKQWKNVPIPFRSYAPEDINDPNAENLRIDFLRKRVMPIENDIPINIFFPQDTAAELNPLTIAIEPGEDVEVRDGIPYYTRRVYVRDVSQLFLDIVRKNMVIFIIATPKNEREILQWSVEVIDPQEMEDTYAAYRISDKAESNRQFNPQKREQLLRERFREYLRKVHLVNAKGEKIYLNSTLENRKIVISRTP